MSRWLGNLGLDVDGLTARRSVEFMRAHHAAGHRFPKSAVGLVPMLRYLRAVGAAPLAEAPVRTVGEELVERFVVFLANERGLATGTIAGYRHVASVMIAALGGHDGDLARLTAADVNKFVLAQCAQRSVPAAKNLVTGLRALLRFLHVEGITAMALSGAVPTVSGCNSGLPRGIDARSVELLCSSCDLDLAKGRRDLAILRLLTRLGMRAGEVAVLELRTSIGVSGRSLFEARATNDMDRPA